MMSFSVPPGYQRTAQIKRPKLDAFTGFIDQWLQEDLTRNRKQRHIAKRIFERLRDEHGFRGGYTTVKNYVREHGLSYLHAWETGSQAKAGIEHWMTFYNHQRTYSSLGGTPPAVFYRRIINATQPDQQVQKVA